MMLVSQFRLEIGYRRGANDKEDDMCVCVCVCVTSADEGTAQLIRIS